MGRHQSDPFDDTILKPGAMRLEGIIIPRMAPASVAIEDVAKQVVDTGHHIETDRKNYEAAKPALHAARQSLEALHTERQHIVAAEPPPGPPEKKGFFATTWSVLTGKFFSDAETHDTNALTSATLLENVTGRVKNTQKEIKTLEPIVTGFEALTASHDVSSKSLKKLIGLLPEHAEMTISRLNVTAGDRKDLTEIKNLVVHTHIEAEREKKLHHAAAAEADVLKGKATVASSHATPHTPAHTHSPHHGHGKR